MYVHVFQGNKNRHGCVADDGHQITFVLMDSRVFVSGVSLGAVLSGLSCFRPLWLCLRKSTVSEL